MITNFRKAVPVTEDEQVLPHYKTLKGRLNITVTRSLCQEFSDNVDAIEEVSTSIRRGVHEVVYGEAQRKTLELQDVLARARGARDPSVFDAYVYRAEALCGQVRDMLRFNDYEDEPERIEGGCRGGKKIPVKVDPVEACRAFTPVKAEPLQPERSTTPSGCEIESNVVPES